jgi:CRP-like cAMP-binding protein
MTTERASDALASTPLFAKLTQQELEELATSVQRRRYTAGQDVYRLGSAPDELFVVVEGEVELLIPADDGDDVLSARQPTSVFGEMAVLDGQPRMVLARAKTDVDVRIVKREAFLKVLGSNPQVREALHDVMVQITRQLARERGDAGVELLRTIASAMRRASTSTLGSAASS